VGLSHALWVVNQLSGIELAKVDVCTVRWLLTTLCQKGDFVTEAIIGIEITGAGSRDASQDDTFSSPP
jgi:hypothetical protein